MGVLPLGIALGSPKAMLLGSLFDPYRCEGWLITCPLLNLYVMHKAALDMMFVLVSSLVATGVFYYGISADTNNKMNIPD